MITCRCSDHAIAELLITELRHTVVGAAPFVGVDRREVLAFYIDGKIV